MLKGARFSPSTCQRESRASSFWTGLEPGKPQPERERGLLVRKHPELNSAETSTKVKRLP